MSLRLLKKHLGDEKPEASQVAKSVVQPLKRSKGGGKGKPVQDLEEFLAEAEVDDRSAAMLREAPPDVQQAVLARGPLLGTRDPSQVLRARIRQAGGDAGGGKGGGKAGGSDGSSYFSERPADDGPRVMAPQMGRFQGTSVQAAHVAATKKAAADQAREKEQEWKNASELAVKSGLGLRAVEERKQKEEEERQAKREAARARRKGEVAHREVSDVKALEECEEQAWQDSEENDRVKYEAALIVRIAIRFGSSGVWVKIAEARSRGAEIPLDAKRVYLLAHPDKCPLPEAADATAILNAQRPPEMTESRAAAKSSAEGSKAAVAARVAAAQQGGGEQRIDPEDDQACSFAELLQKYSGVYTEEELQGYWEFECKPAQAKEAPAGKKSTEAEEQRPAPASEASEEDGLQKVDPEDGKLCTFGELQKKYSGMYSAEELKEYWSIECKAAPQPGGAEPTAAAASAAADEDEGLPGLCSWLRRMSLESYAEEAVLWAEVQGAVGLDEIVESMDDFASDLGMKPFEVERLKADGEAAAAAVASGEPEPVKSKPPAAPEAEVKRPAASPPNPSSASQPRSYYAEPATKPASGAYVEPAESSSQSHGYAASVPQPASTSRPQPPAAKPATAAEEGRDCDGAQSAASNRASARSTGPAPSSIPAEDEKRIDPETGKAVTMAELFKVYRGQYSLQELDEYWNVCEPAGAGAGATPEENKSSPAGDKETRSVREMWSAGRSKKRY
eukprot:TRINITY_DN34366_c0_g1_i1.p1 TRINITY_DN34366_c0_g1~~TRINITY_DN34366_c0_g1_i1.p1  ORF type:complete len:734 (-),score=206.33 TRINITY_DN34366_c0_g1_i1:159-2360(-)